MLAREKRASSEIAAHPLERGVGDSRVSSPGKIIPEYPASVVARPALSLVSSGTGREVSLHNRCFALSRGSFMPIHAFRDREPLETTNTEVLIQRHYLPPQRRRAAQVVGGGGGGEIHPFLEQTGLNMASASLSKVQALWPWIALDLATKREAPSPEYFATDEKLRLFHPQAFLFSIIRTKAVAAGVGKEGCHQPGSMRPGK